MNFLWSTMQYLYKHSFCVRQKPLTNWFLFSLCTTPACKYCIQFYCLFIVELLLGLSSLSIWSHLHHPCALIVPIRLPLLLWWKTPLMNTGIIYYHWIYLQINVLLYTASEWSLLQTELYFHPPRSIWLKALWRCICCTWFRSWSVTVSIWLPIEKLNICFSKEELWYFFWLIKK